ncbi:MAG: BatA domain-containing protein [Phycisphaerae bacterium]
MTFIDRSILVGLVALVIPLVVHLLGRRRPRKVELPTARFAEGAHAAARGRLWLKRLGLLGLRLAAVALIVLALAGPRVGGGPAGPAGRWLLVLDASASMRARAADGQTAFAHARGRLDAVLAALSDEAAVTLALTDGREADGSPEEVRRALAAMPDPGWGAEPLGRTLREALAAADESADGGAARLVVATDATPAAVADIRPGAFAEADLDVTLLGLPPGGGNAWLALPRVTVEAEDGRPVVCVEAEVRTSDPKTDVRPSLSLDGTGHRGRGFRGDGRVRFRAPRPDGGPWQGTLRIGARPTMGWSSAPDANNPRPLTDHVDVLSVDNVRYVTAAAPQAAGVLVVDAAEEPDARVRSADLVAAAFAGETDAPRHVTRSAVGDADRADLAPADLVFWVGAKPPAADGLLAGPRPPVVWLPADAEPPAAALAQALGLAFGDAEAVPDGATVDPAGYTSDLLAAFEGGTSGDLAAAVFRRRLRWDEPPAPRGKPAAGRATVAARFRDGAPAILARHQAKVETVALAVGPAPRWGDLASRPEWVVLAHSLVEALAPAGGVRTLNLTVAEAARRGLKAESARGAMGTAERADADLPLRPGNYTGTDARGRPVRWSVNVDPAETADLEPDAARLAAAFADGACRVVGPEADLPAAIPGLSGPAGRDLTPYLVVLLAAALLAEGLVAWWASPRRWR